MNTLILLAAALVPALLLWLYIWLKDPQKEPFGQLLKAFALGVVVVFVASGLESFVKDSFWGANEQTYSLLDTTSIAFFVAAIPEESLKLLALWLLLRRNPYFDEHFDGIVYAVSIGLGFAAIENLCYIIGGGDKWATIAISRSLLAVPGHYAFAVLMGYFYSVYHFVDKSLKNKVLILLAPVLAHGIYDTLALSGMADQMIGGISAFVLIYFCIRLHKYAYKKIMVQINRDHNDMNIMV